MIRGLRSILGPQHQRAFTEYLGWAVSYGVLQGLSVCLLIPIAHRLVSGDLRSAWSWLAVLAAAAAVTCVAHYLQAMKGFRVALALLRSMHLNLGDHLVTLPLGWFTGQTGTVAQIAAKGTISVSSSAAHLMTPLIVGLSAPTTVAVVLIIVDWRLGIVLVAAAPIILLTARASARLISRSAADLHATADEASDRVIEFARCQPVLRAFGRTGEAGYRPLERAITEQQRAARRNLVDGVAGIALNGVAVQALFTVLVALTASLALGGSMAGWEVLALLGVSSRFVQPLAEVAEFGGTIRLARADLERIQRIMETPALPETVAGQQLTAPGALELRGVSFGYGTGPAVLADVSFRVEAGTMTARVGPSGSGKTTISRLLARFYDVDAGSVLVGGVDVREQRSEDLQRQLAMVFQDVYLFDDTLWENIQIGNRTAPPEQVRRAAGLAGVQEIVDRLPQGWQTRVGEAGSALSGGERQRVSIARALVKGAPIVLLDEATAALDPENERFLQESMQSLRGRCTLLVIAHRLSTVVSAEEILVLNEAGQVAERGTHQDLLARGGRYAAFWRERSSARGWRLGSAHADRAALLPEGG